VTNWYRFGIKGETMKLTEEHKNSIRKGMLNYYAKHEKKAMDMTGEKFNRLTVIKRSYKKNHLICWLCKCDCGTEINVAGINLRSGRVKSCGCLHHNWMKPELASMRYVIHDYKKSAKERGLEYNLTDKQFAGITQQDCFYCGAKPNNTSKYSNNNNGIYIYNGIDRIDNNKGYIIDNIVPCCTRCNYAKKNFTLEDYKNWIKNSYIKMFFN